ncbi:hypothetical protein ACJMK2_016680 [Sinanodonta woodiana]|uniref:C1q domain-containing protein n=1 Tax=Sinanodonta woodiana TaxID=1069815 RepID=A0ABD3UX45_SINWO
MLRANRLLLQRSCLFSFSFNDEKANLHLDLLLTIRLHETYTNISYNLHVLILSVSDSPEDATSRTAVIAFTATLSKETRHFPGQTVIFNNVKLNEGNCYDSSTGRFRAHFRGLYIFSVTIRKGTGTHIHLLIMKDDVEIGRIFSGTSSFDSGSVTVVTVMEKGQVTYVKETYSETETMLGDHWAHFTGLLHIRYK